MGKIKLLSPVAWLSPLHLLPSEGVASGSPAGCMGWGRGGRGGADPRGSNPRRLVDAVSTRAPLPLLSKLSHSPARACLPTSTSHHSPTPPLGLGPQIVADDCGSSELGKERLHCQTDFDPKFNLGNSLLFPHFFVFFCFCLIHV